LSGVASKEGIGYTFSVTFEPNEIIQGVSSAIIAAGAVQGVFLGALFLFRSAGRRIGRRAPDALLAALMLAFAANILHAGILRPLLLPDGLRHTVLEPFQLLFGPLVYGYVRSLVMPVSMRSRIWPAIGTLSAFLGITALFSLAETHPGFAGSSRKIFDALSWIVTLAYLFHYLAKTHRLVQAHRKNVLDEFSDARGVDLSWVRVFVVVFMLVESIWAVLLVWVIHAEPSPHFGYVNACVSSLVVYGLGFRALLQRQDVKLPSSEKYVRSAFAAGELAPLRESLDGVMARERPWLDSELNLQDLAERAGMSRHTLTEVLNRACGMNFYDYVNGWRIDEFKRRVSLPESDSFTLLAIAFDSGFNSKGTFNAAFLKSAGMTPSAWRKANRAG
jgi:AraC-like DNA-binding protein